MLPLTITIFALVGTGILFSIIDLGLSAYGASVAGKSYDCSYDSGNPYDGTYGVVSATCKGTVPAAISFLLFTSLWTLIVGPFTLVYPWLQARKASVSHESLNRWLSPVIIALFFLTWVFWLSSFADIATYNIVYSGSIIQAAVAFAVLNWLIFTAVFVLTVILACGILAHDLPGFQPLRTNNRNVAAGPTPTYNNSAPMTQDHHIINEEPKNQGYPEMTA